MTVELDSVYRVVSKKGGVYLYAWKGKGAPRLREEPGTQAFIDELSEALKSRKTGDATKISGLCAKWRASDAWIKPREDGGLAPNTKKVWGRVLDDIQVHFGKLRIVQFDRQKAIRPHIKTWRDQWKDRPRQADMAKQVLSALLTFAVDENLLEKNPCIGLKNYYQNDRSERIWTNEQLARLEEFATPEVMAATRLAALTGLRQSDLLRLCWSDVGEFAIERRTGKSQKGRSFKTALIPLYTELKEALATIPRRSPIILTNTSGKPWKSGFDSSWRKALRDAGFLGDGIDADLHFHDLRGTAATKMYLGGLTIREIAEMFAWTEDRVERLIDRYVKRDELLKDRIRRLEENARRTEPEKSPEKRPG